METSETGGAGSLNDLQRYAVEEYVEHYHDGLMSRRELVRRVLPIAGGVAATAALLATLGCAPATSPLPTPTAPSSRPAAGAPGAARSKFSVKADDPAIAPADVTFPGEGATLLGYLVLPKSAGPWPAVLVCHEIFGLSEHIRDVTRRLAKNGYAALAVDLLSRDGGTAKVDPTQMGAKLTADPAQKVSDFQSGFAYLESLGSVKKSAIGMIGFCFGGGITWRVATAIADLKAAVEFYGPNPPLADVPKIHAAILGLYGGLDQRVDAGIPAIEAAMKQNAKIFQKVIYPGANHAFHNDTGPAWNPEAAYDAWGRALDWFKQYLV